MHTCIFFLQEDGPMYYDQWKRQQQQQQKFVVLHLTDNSVIKGLCDIL